MAEEVNTPLGPERVLTIEELKAEVTAQTEEKKKNYVRQPDGTYRHRDCGEIILVARVAHPIWDGPFPLSGRGLCIYENVPFCQNCEEKPDPDGSPVAPKGSYHNP